MCDNDEKDSNVTAEEIDETAREEAAAAPRVDYEKEMAQDAAAMAQGLADMLAQAMGRPVQVKLHALQDPNAEPIEAGADIPKPTLESLREHAAEIAASFVNALTEIRQTRTKDREEGAPRALIRFLHSGDADAIRKYAASRKRFALYSQLEPDALRDLLAVKIQDNAAVAMAIGIYTGWLLTHGGLSLQEVVDCAEDRVFVMQALALRVTPETSHKLAMEVFEDVAKAERDRALRQAD